MAEHERRVHAHYRANRLDEGSDKFVRLSKRERLELHRRAVAAAAAAEAVP